MNYATFYSTNDHDRVECIPSEYRAMVKRAHELTQRLGEHDTKQALVLQTADGQLYEGIMDYKSPMRKMRSKHLWRKSERTTRLYG